jgi:hypothetical protein
MAKKKISEECPPRQAKFNHGASDVIDMQTTARPLGDPHISTQPGNAECLNQNNVHRPVYSDKESRFIFPSSTDGKKHAGHS